MTLIWQILFQSVNYGLAALIWLMIGRFCLQLIIPKEFDHFIWNSFVRLSNPFLKLIGWITPSPLHGFFLIPIAVFWAVCLRIALGYFYFLLV